MDNEGKRREEIREWKYGQKRIRKLGDTESSSKVIILFELVLFYFCLSFFYSVNSRLSGPKSRSGLRRCMPTVLLHVLVHIVYQYPLLFICHGTSNTRSGGKEEDQRRTMTRTKEKTWGGNKAVISHSYLTRRIKTFFPILSLSSFLNQFFLSVPMRYVYSPCSFGFALSLSFAVILGTLCFCLDLREDMLEVLLYSFSHTDKVSVRMLDICIPCVVMIAGFECIPDLHYILRFNWCIV